MKNIILLSCLMIAFYACKQDQKPEVEPENPDWYILTAPDAHSIQAAYGDIDGTLLISTGAKIYKTTNKGKTWQLSPAPNQWSFSFTNIQDTLLALNTMRTLWDANQEKKEFAMLPTHYSVDQGSSWKPYNSRYDVEDFMVPMNSVNSSVGTEYIIDFLPVSIGNYTGSEPAGIRTSKGQKISLPQNHQISTLYFDKKDRLYVSASGPICSYAPFSFCNGENGTLYVSKKAQL